MKYKFRQLAGKALMVSATLFLGTQPAMAVTLGSASSFAVLGASTVTNTGPSNISGNLGVSPGSAITGFPPGQVSNGSVQAANAVAGQAQVDAMAAYVTAAGMASPPGNDLTGQDLGGKTLVPGVYRFSSSAQLTGTLTLDAQGNPNALFVFQIGSTLVTASDANVVVINGNNGCINIIWQVGSSATLGTGTAFVGRILALASITMTTDASLVGSAIALTAAVTMDSNDVTTCRTSPGGVGGDHGNADCGRYGKDQNGRHWKMHGDRPGRDKGRDDKDERRRNHGKKDKRGDNRHDRDDRNDRDSDNEKKEWGR